jgi:uncharacterized membrane protein
MQLKVISFLYFLKKETPARIVPQVTPLIKDEVLLTVGFTIFHPYLFIANYLFTGSFKNRSIDI